MFPYELLREGAGVCGGDTRAERMRSREFIVVSKPWRTPNLQRALEEAINREGQRVGDPKAALTQI
jgi:hypothetical protein